MWSGMAELFVRGIFELDCFFIGQRHYIRPDEYQKKNGTMRVKGPYNVVQFFYDVSGNVVRTAVYDCGEQELEGKLEDNHGHSQRINTEDHHVFWELHDDEVAKHVREFKLFTPGLVKRKLDEVLGASFQC